MKQINLKWFFLSLVPAVWFTALVSYYGGWISSFAVAWFGSWGLFFCYKWLKGEKK